jgi:hypothetical protein
MSKRKRASLGKTTPASEQQSAGDESSEGAREDMVHVTPDLLAGSPDIFSAKSKGATTPPAEPEPAASETPETVSEPMETEPAAEAARPSETMAAAEETAAPAEEEAAAAVIPEPAPKLAPEPPAPPPPPRFTPMPPPRRGGTATSAALGIVFVVVGLFALLVAMVGIDLSQYGWPLFVIVPGLTLLVVGFVGLGQGASVPGGIVTMLGLVLAYQSSTGDWASWAYAWALVAPFGIGLGMYLQALRDRDSAALRTGRTLMFIGLLIFMIGFVFFESILGISGRDYGIFGKIALPILVIVIGAILLVRSIQRSRRA